MYVHEGTQTWKLHSYKKNTNTIKEEISVFCYSVNDLIDQTW
jgi:hypothetical protein